MCWNRTQWKEKAQRTWATSKTVVSSGAEAVFSLTCSRKQKIADTNNVSSLRSVSEKSRHHDSQPDPRRMQPHSPGSLSIPPQNKKARHRDYQPVTRRMQPRNLGDSLSPRPPVNVTDRRQGRYFDITSEGTGGVHFEDVVLSRDRARFQSAGFVSASRQSGPDRTGPPSYRPPTRHTPYNNQPEDHSKGLRRVKSKAQRLFSVPRSHPINRDKPLPRAPSPLSAPTRRLSPQLARLSIASDSTTGSLSRYLSARRVIRMSVENSLANAAGHSILKYEREGSWIVNHPLTQDNQFKCPIPQCEAHYGVRPRARRAHQIRTPVDTLFEDN